MIKRFGTICMLLLSAYSTLANDGAFYAKGNQLIPITESNISVKKEILTLKKVQNRYIEVTVYYEFFNPDADKKIAVGFEAFSPMGDVDGEPKNGHHPYMRDFTVEVNSKILPYNISYVNDSLYNKNGHISSINLNTFDGEKSGNYVDFFYVYHFDVEFKKGKNIIKHTYSYDLSGSVNHIYNFEYVLTAANRWANRQIDDFTLIIDNGDFETFLVDKTFFSKADEWLLNGIGKTENVKGNENSLVESDAVKFHIQRGSLIFQKKNFHPQGDLFIYALNYSNTSDLSYIPFTYFFEPSIDNPPTDIQKKILKNLPFARRGYVFQNKDLSDYYSKLDWYIPNPSYIPEVDHLTEIEKLWIKKWNN